MGGLNIILRMSLTASIIFLLYLLLQPISKKHFSSSWHYRILILIMMVYILPISNFIKLPTIGSISSRGNLQIKASKAFTNSNKEVSESQIANSENIGNRGPEFSEKDRLKDGNIDDSRVRNQGSQKLEVSRRNYEDLIKHIWLLGCFVFLTFHIWAYLNFKSRLKKASIPLDDKDILELFNSCKKELDIRDQLELRSSELIGSPMVVGLFQAQVFMPRMDLDYKSLEMIFLHELNHHKRKDILIKLGGLLINAVHWFNPLVYVFIKEIDKQCEYSIDEKLVVDLDMKARKDYGEIIISLVDNNQTRARTMTTAMGTKGRQLKARLENMVYSFKTSKKKRFISILVGFIILLSGCSLGQSIFQDKIVEGNDSLVAYIKDDGLYYSYLEKGQEIKIHEADKFRDPLISKGGSYIAYTKDSNLYIYNLKEDTEEKLADGIEDQSRSYDWLDDETIVYTSYENPGFSLFNLRSRDKFNYLDQYYYRGLVSYGGSMLYARREGQKTQEEDIFSDGIVEIDLRGYEKGKDKFKFNMLVLAQEANDESLGYNPMVWNISDNGRYLYIMEKVYSGSYNSDMIGIGIYDLKKKVYKQVEDTETLAYKNHLALNPTKDMSALIEGAGRDMIDNKEVSLLEIEKGEIYKTVGFMKENQVAMTPSFSLDGSRLFYSASQAMNLEGISDYNQLYKDWEDQAHNIYQYDLESGQIKNLTTGDNFDLLPREIDKNQIIFLRKSGPETYSLIRLVDDQEELLVEGLIFKGGRDNEEFGFYGHIDTEKGLDIYIKKDK